MLPWSRAHADMLLALAIRQPPADNPEVLLALIDCGFIRIVAGQPRLTEPLGRERVRELVRAMSRPRGRSAAVERI